jgi:hypothetical protein
MVHREIERRFASLCISGIFGWIFDVAAARYGMAAHA